MAKYIVKLTNVKGSNAEVQFECADNKYILEGAEEANIDLPYSCRAGSCSTCLGKVVTGKVDQPDQSFLDESQLKDGFVLTCVAYASSDVTISTNEEENLY